MGCNYIGFMFCQTCLHIVGLRGLHFSLGVFTGKLLGGLEGVLPGRSYG